MVCPNCGATLTDDAKFCSYCGVKIELKTEVETADPVKENTADFEDETTYEEPIVSDVPKKPSLSDKIKSAILCFWGKLNIYEKTITIALIVFIIAGLVALLFGRTYAAGIVLVQIILTIAILLMEKQKIRVKVWVPVATLALIVVLIGPFSFLFRENYENAERFTWSDIELNEIIPKPSSSWGEIEINTTTDLYLSVEKFSSRKYNDYTNACIKKGFTVDQEIADDLFTAYNEEGYRLILEYDISYNSLEIMLSAAPEYETIEWPSGILPSLIPMPQSLTGEVIQDDGITFSVRISHTPIETMKEYITACSESGFTKEAAETEKTYTAKNAEGYQLSIYYEGNNTIIITVKIPEYAVDLKVKCDQNLMFSQYDVDVYLDDQYLGTVSHGKERTFSESTYQGIHQLRFEKWDDEAITGEAQIDIQQAGALSISIHCFNVGISVEGDIVKAEETNTPVPSPSQEAELSQEPERDKEETVSMPKNSEEYKNLNYEEVQKELEELGFVNIELEENKTTDPHVDGAVTSVTVNGNAFSSGEIFKTDTPIVIAYWKVDVPVSKYELAFVSETTNYSLYYMFDFDDRTVVNFGTNDTSISEGNYTGEFNSGVTITWEHGEWTEQFFYEDGSSTGKLIDGTGFDWEYELCDLGEAQSVLDTLNREISVTTMEPAVTGNITIDNDSDFSALMQITDQTDAVTIKRYVDAHEGDVIEFDGCVAFMMKHKNYNTRFDVLLVGGDYNAERVYGPLFAFEDVNFNDMNVSGADTVAGGMNFHFIAEIEDFSDEGGYIVLEPVSMKSR